MVPEEFPTATHAQSNPWEAEEDLVSRSKMWSHLIRLCQLDPREEIGYDGGRAVAIAYVTSTTLVISTDNA